MVVGALNSSNHRAAAPCGSAETSHGGTSAAPPISTSATHPVSVAMRPDVRLTPHQPVLGAPSSQATYRSSAGESAATTSATEDLLADTHRSIDAGVPEMTGSGAEAQSAAALRPESPPFFFEADAAEEPLVDFDRKAVHSSGTADIIREDCIAGGATASLQPVPHSEALDERFGLAPGQQASLPSHTPALQPAGPLQECGTAGAAQTSRLASSSSSSCVQPPPHRPLLSSAAGGHVAPALRQVQESSVQTQAGPLARITRQPLGLHTEEAATNSDTILRPAIRSGLTTGVRCTTQGIAQETASRGACDSEDAASEHNDGKENELAGMARAVRGPKEGKSAAKPPKLVTSSKVSHGCQSHWLVTAALSHTCPHLSTF